jgi:hypothetical protein
MFASRALTPFFPVFGTRQGADKKLEACCWRTPRDVPYDTAPQKDPKGEALPASNTILTAMRCAIWGQSCPGGFTKDSVLPRLPAGLSVNEGA